MTRLFAALSIMFLLTAFRPPPAEKITQEELVRRTQELADSVAPGNVAFGVHDADG